MSIHYRNSLLIKSRDKKRWSLCIVIAYFIVQGGQGGLCSSLSNPQNSRAFTSVARGDGNIRVYFRIFQRVFDQNTRNQVYTRKQRALVQRWEEGFPNSSQPLSPCFVLGTADFMGRDDATNVARFSLVNPARFITC